MADGEETEIKQDVYDSMLAASATVQDFLDQSAILAQEKSFADRIDAPVERSWFF